MIPRKTLEEMKRRMLLKIEAYDSSPAVNQFYIDNGMCWLDKASRVSLNYALNIARDSGEETIDIWYERVKYTFPINKAKLMLAEVEAYAFKCFNVTAEHKRNVEMMTDIGEISQYNYTAGYPKKLAFFTSPQPEPESESEKVTEEANEVQQEPTEDNAEATIAEPTQQ